MLKGSQAEKDAKERGDWNTALEEFKKLQTDFHEKSNNAKNASLYVDWKDGEFVAPRERISTEMLVEIIGRNETFLDYAHNSLQMLRRLDQASDEMQGMVLAFVETAEKIRAENPKDAMSAMNELIRKFVDVERNKQRDRPEELASCQRASLPNDRDSSLSAEDNQDHPWSEDVQNDPQN